MRKVGTGWEMGEMEQGGLYIILMPDPPSCINLDLHQQLILCRSKLNQAEAGGYLMARERMFLTPRRPPVGVNLSESCAGATATLCRDLVRVQLFMLRIS